MWQAQCAGRLSPWVSYKHWPLSDQYVFNRVMLSGQIPFVSSNARTLFIFDLLCGRIVLVEMVPLTAKRRLDKTSEKDMEG